MVSLEKEKKEGTSTTLLTGTLSKSVNTVNKLLQNKIFNSEVQRIRKDQLDKVNEIALKHGRKRFSEVLDLLLYCYDYLEEIRNKYNLSSIVDAIEYIDENLPKNEADVIVHEVLTLLRKLHLDDPVLEKTLISILFKIKLRGEDPKEVCRWGFYD